MLNNGAAPVALTIGNDNTNTTFDGKSRADGANLLQLIKTGTGIQTLTVATLTPGAPPLQQERFSLATVGRPGALWVMSRITESWPLIEAMR